MFFRMVFHCKESRATENMALCQEILDCQQQLAVFHFTDAIESGTQETDAAAER
jgi:hypothetical protein